MEPDTAVSWVLTRILPVRLADLCTTNASLMNLSSNLRKSRHWKELSLSKLLPDHPAQVNMNDLDALIFPPADTPNRFYPQMLDWVAGEIKRLITEEGVSPAEIVVLVHISRMPYGFRSATDWRNWKFPGAPSGRRVPCATNQPAIAC